MRTFGSIPKLFLAVLLLACAPLARADIALWLFDDKGHQVLGFDGEVGFDLSPDAGTIIYNGAVGDWSLNVAIGISEPVTGPPYPHLDLNSLDVSSRAGTLTLYLSAYNLPYVVPGFQMEIGGVVDRANYLSELTYSAYYDHADAGFPFNLTTKIGELGPFSSGAFSGSEGFAAAPTPNYSLTQVIEIHHGGAGFSSFDAEIQALPEPTSILLLGTVMLGLGGLIRRRMDV